MGYNQFSISKTPQSILIPSRETGNIKLVSFVLAFHGLHRKWLAPLSMLNISIGTTSMVISKESKLAGL